VRLLPCAEESKKKKKERKKRKRKRKRKEKKKKKKKKKKKVTSFYFLDFFSNFSSFSIHLGVSLLLSSSPSQDILQVLTKRLIS